MLKVILNILTLIFGGLSILFNLYVLTSDIRMRNWKKKHCKNL